MSGSSACGRVHYPPSLLDHARAGRRFRQPPSRVAAPAPIESVCLDCTVAARPALGSVALRRGDKWPLTPHPLSPSPPPTLPGREGLQDVLRLTAPSSPRKDGWRD